MSIHPAYATAADLAEYLDILEADLPDGFNRLIKRASEMVHQAIFENYIETNTSHVEAVKLATCAQVEFWMRVDEEVAITGGVQKFSIEGVSMEFGDISNKSNKLCARGYKYLMQQGLLYCGLSKAQLTET